MPAARIKGGIQLIFKEVEKSSTEVRIKPITEKTQDGHELQIGWIILTDISAENKDAAIKETGGLIDGILSSACLITGISFEVVKPELVYNIDKKTTNEFMQLFDSEIIPSRRKLNDEFFIELLEKIRNPPMKEYSDRIVRAIRWYRMGTLITDDVLTSYDCFWKGLESLNKPLADLLNAPETYFICSKCGKETKQSTTLGIKKFMIDNYPDGETLYRKYRGFRVSIVHSTKKIIDILPEVTSSYQNLAGILYDAIMFLLEIKMEKTYDSILDHKMRIALEGFLLKNNGEELLYAKKDPYLSPKDIQVLTVNELDNDVTLSYNAELSVELPEGYTLKIDTMRLYGQEIIDFQVEEIGKK